jgi:predicted ATPase with chaperone activity
MTATHGLSWGALTPDENDLPVMPPTPDSLEETGLQAGFVTDLLLRTMYVRGAILGHALAESVRLPFPIIDDLLLTMQHRRLAEVRSVTGPSRGTYVFDLTDAGRGRAREAMESLSYVGPAPVPLAQYRVSVGAQSIRHARVNQAAVHQGLSWLVLDGSTVDMVGPAINSAKSLFLYGDSGNGKTAIAETIAGMLGGSQYIPYAVEVNGEVLVLFDPVYHRPDTSSTPERGADTWLGTASTFDRRYELIKRPVVLTGGELSLDQLDLQYDAATKLYQSPFQMKANGGVLIVDDFGRQRVPPRDLLNRWIVPLEKKVDYLTLHTGGKFPVPFDCLLIFATNIPPTQLVEEAFLRRIHYKIRVESPTREQYERIFERYCNQIDLPYDPLAVAQIYGEFYQGYSIAPRGCHPRDLIDHLRDIATYLETDAKLTPQLVRLAGNSYFLDFPTARPGEGT